MAKIGFVGFGEVNTPVDVIVRKCSAAEAALMGSFAEHPQAPDSVQDATPGTQSNGNEPDGNGSNDNDNSDVTGKDTRA